jgi:penicillin amidase/acyl-homoserine-lactone acylase
MKTLLRYGLALLTLAVVVTGGYVLATLPPQVDTAPLLARGDDYRVRIIRDDFGVPHIYGERDIDTAFGLAYAHAEDDFATIQEVLLATRGRLAAVNGPGAAQTDYLIHLMQVWPAVEAGYDTQLTRHTRDIAQAYADGLNLYAAQHPQQVFPYMLPVEGKDIIAGFTFKTPLFYGFDGVLGELFSGGEPRQLAKQGDLALRFTDQPQPEIGSQGVAVAPARSADGATRLLVNSHQPLTGPVAWYEARLHSQEGWDIAGGTFPGSPLILHGHNRHLGWSNTVNKPDLVDVYQLHLNPDDDNQYLLDGEWRDLEQASADILVKLVGPLRWTFSEPLYFSEHGPVLKLEHGAYALRWAGMGEIRMLEQMLAINKARNIAEFETALAIGAQPSINYVYADAEGNIAHYYNATFPRRAEGWDWTSDLPGDRSDLIWRDYLPFSAIPMTRNPPSGFVFNANNTPFVSSVGDGQPRPDQFSATLGIETHLTNRAHRLRRLLDAENPISREAFRRIKYDLNYDEDLPGMQRFREYVAAGLDPAAGDLEEPFELLASWDGSTHRDNRAAALALLTLAPLLDFRQLDEAADLTASLRAATQHLQTHFGRVDPRFGDINRLRRGEREWALDGGPDILRAVYGLPDEEQGTLVNVAGDSYIMFVEWDERGEVSSTSVHNFGSATLNSDSPHYSDQTPLFVEMREKPVHLELDQLLMHASRDYTPQQAQKR